MRNSDTVAKLRQRLVELGCPPSHVGETIQEISDHRDDLRQAGVIEGLTEVEAEARAESRLGDPKTLAKQLMVAYRRTSWWGRHPFIGFFLLPPLTMIFMMGIAAGLVVTILDCGIIPPQERMILASGGPGFQYLVALKSGIYYWAIGVVTIFFCCRVRRAGLGFKWWMAVCSLGILQGLFAQLRLVPHNVSFGYWRNPNWVGAIFPLTVALSLGVWHWRIRKSVAEAPASGTGSKLGMASSALIVAGLVATCLSGCSSTRQASAKPILQRGWIGGQYKVVGKRSTKGSEPRVAVFPDSLTNTASHGLLITALGTNTPAHLAGLREGDLILAVENRPVTEVKALRRVIDGAEPGTTLGIRAFRDGATTDYQVRVGRESFEQWHTVGFGLFVRRLKLSLGPDFSLVAAGFQRNPKRVEFGEVETTFARTYGPAGTSTRSGEGWEGWLGIIGLGSYKEIRSQEVVVPAAANAIAAGGQ